MSVQRKAITELRDFVKTVYEFRLLTDCETDAAPFGVCDYHAMEDLMATADAALAAESQKPIDFASYLPSEAFVCPECGPYVTVDEDECCATCGADTEVVPKAEALAAEAGGADDGDDIRISIDVYQQDGIEAFGVYMHPDGSVSDAKPLIGINVEALLGTVVMGDVASDELPYVVAETVIHELFHALEAWAGVEFSEDRIHALTEKYQAAALAAEPPAESEVE